MNTQLLITFSTAFLISISVFGILVIIGAMIYDLSQIDKAKHLKKVVNKLQKPKQPSVTVLIYSENAGSTLLKCINSVSHSYYKNYQIIVANNASIDETKKLVKLYKDKHPGVPLILYSKRVKGSRAETLRRAYKKVKASELVFAVDAKNRVLPKTLKELVAQFYDDSNLNALRLGQKIISSPSLFVVLGQFLQISNNQFNKFRYLLPLRTSGLKGTNMYTSETFNHLAKLQNNGVYYKPKARFKYAYHGNMYITSQTDAKLKTLLLNIPQLPKILASTARPNRKTMDLKNKFLEVIFGIIYFTTMTIIFMTPLLIAYFIHTATTLQSSTFLITSWLIVLVWLLAAIWADEHSGIKEKLRLTFCSPIFYFMLPIIIVGVLIKAIVSKLFTVNLKPIAHEKLKTNKTRATRLIRAT